MAKSNINTWYSKGLLIGHRGLCGYALENTIESIKAAKNHGLTHIEIDVSQLKDGELCIFHDFQLSRLTNQQGTITSINNAKLNEIKLLPSTEGFTSSYPIPSLKDTINLCLELNLAVNLELKIHDSKVDSYIKSLSEINISPNLNVLWSSSSIELLSALRKTLKPNYEKNHHETALICEQLTTNTINEAQKINASAIHLNYEHISKNDIKAIHQAKMHCACFTVNDKSKAKSLISSGVDAIFSDKLTKL